DELPLPFCFVSAQTGMTLYEAWRISRRAGPQIVRMCQGSAETQQAQLEIACKHGHLAVDPLALFTLQGLGYLSLLGNRRRVVFAHISLLDAIVEELRLLRDHPPSGRIGSHQGQLYYTNADPTEQADMVSALAEIRDF